MSFDTLALQPADPLLKIIGAFRRDTRTEKIDLGVGVFRDEDGNTPVMRAVKLAEEKLLREQQSKSYLGPEGDIGFVERLADKVLGNAVPVERRHGLQTPGGTGALRLAAELLAKAGVRRIWVAAPSWANHAPVFLAAGIEPRFIECFSIAAQHLDLAYFLEELDGATPGDAVLLHGCCHNPMGIDPGPLGWQAITEVVVRRGLLPLVDLAYQGLGEGFCEDSLGTRILLAAAPFGLLAYSCDKNFGLYRERVGALWVTAPDAEQGAIAHSNLLALARANWSMPPDHGAAVVRVILEDAELTRIWREELDMVRERLAGLRRALASEGRIGKVDLTQIARGKGMFATLPLSRTQIDWLRDEHAIYLAGSGRINIAGFTLPTIARFCDALRALDRAGVS
ncbi:aromatic amino acid transaminase [Sphingomonas sp. OTU376]|uniref:aromatic amino acid transaminase n=1 Tax=Sphingomonas sp. OTU376 TaxID=3043863 RepID=UPI00313DA40E